jgi:hypothetical protein
VSKLDLAEHSQQHACSIFRTFALISTSSGTSSSVEAVRPPVEESGRANVSWLRPKRRTELGLRLLPAHYRGEMAIDQRCIGETLQILRWLQFGRV